MPPRLPPRQPQAQSGVQPGQRLSVPASGLELFGPQVLESGSGGSKFGLGAMEIELRALGFEEVGPALEMKAQEGRLARPQQSGPQTVRDSRSSQRRLNQVS